MRTMDTVVLYLLDRGRIILKNKWLNGRQSPQFHKISMQIVDGIHDFGHIFQSTTTVMLVVHGKADPFENGGPGP